ncbi:helix-turn-helix domain-containing protein [Desulfovibrio sp. X2]|uniref:helix-turn-helix domain-containing protein n=1 Tax=Desulfovibrio sp. X2 TaxID=941449 RepID=UPI001267E8F8
MDGLSDLKLLTIAEVAELLRVHRATVSRLLKSGELPYCAIGGRRLVRAQDIRVFIDGHTMNAPGSVGSRTGGQP